MAAPKTGGSLQWVSHEQLTTLPQVRTEANPKADQELQESIAQFGIMQPLLVRPKDGGGYVVVAGHRRLAAATALGLTRIPVLCREVEGDELVAQQLVENIQRAGLSLADVADGVWTLYNGAGGGSAALVAAMLSKPRPWVSKMLMLSAPGKAHSVARSLMASDKLGDIEMAYLICQVEEVDKGVAQNIGKNIENETRETVRAWLNQVRRAAKKGADTDEALQDEEPPKSDDSTPADAFVALIDADSYMLLEHILKHAVVDPIQLDLLARLRKDVAAARPA